ncbi:ergothioneine biosynthesis protein EgtB [filamentous cyanobacterium LEGE 11480]|uniref:Ergothioneine biosynthesis protein EgtB n=2 Tax=Romeriopsis TaxID=2992131 RepID=A0A928VJ35_9CYAN|nr:ergothioneine biosynthesis protein EgtB [Romeriopsis navalis LEGE 11480]
MQHSRAMTLQLFETITPAVFCAQAHEDFSPVGWHLGHIGFTESLWILERLAGQPCAYPQYQKLFAADGLPKQERQNLPAIDEILAYLADIRSQVEAYLTQADLDQEERLWHFLLQHESQHCETIVMVLAALGQQSVHPIGTINSADPQVPPTQRMHIPAGGFWQGQQGPTALDNEQPAHWVELEEYWIDSTLVTGAQFQQFIAAGGYTQPQWWSDAGWQWQQQTQAQQPHYWQPTMATSEHPVCGVSWYEADAYARFRGTRLPTEAEWEKAARWNSRRSQALPWGERWHAETGSDSLFQGADAQTAAWANLSGLDPHQLLRGTTPVETYPAGRSPAGLWDCFGNVWEWTDSWFVEYEGFTAFPYAGYSTTYFDGAHRVLRGGSWATRPWSIRPGFRNWYHPWTRIIFAGFRCVSDTAP